MDEQERVAEFLDRHDMETTLAYHVLDLQSEVGEVAKEVTTSTEYGARPDEAAVAADELGDVCFSLLAADGDAGAGE